MVDAFTNQPFAGNPAAVCIMDSWPSDESMMKLAMENKNMTGFWTGIFESIGDGTRITFTEEVQVKNPIMNLFVKGYLKAQQEKYIASLRETIISR